MTPHILDNYRITPLLFDLGFDVGNARLCIPGAAYVCPSHRWLSTILPEDWTRWRPALPHYSADHFSCTSYALACMLFAAAAHSWTPDAPKARLFFVTVWSSKGLFDGHGFNLGVYHDGQNYVPYFFEPQNSKEIYVKKEQRALCDTFIFPG